MKKTVLKKMASQKGYHQEIIVKPAQRLLKALQEAQAGRTQTKAKIRKTAISR
jgi:ribosomal protein L20